MSVQLKAFAKAIDLPKIKSYLFGSDDTKGNIHIIMIIYTTNKIIFNFFYLDVFNDTVNCVSPGGEIIVFGQSNKIITFTSKCICVYLLSCIKFTIFYNFLFYS